MRASRKAGDRLDAPRGLHTPFFSRHAPRTESDRFGRFTEWIARGMGTPWFLLGLTLFSAVWISWNTLMPPRWRFDSAQFGFIALTLVLSLQASYAAPLILLAQNRQDDRDRVQIEQDRQQAARNLADTEYLAREVVALRLAIQDTATKDFVRAELRALAAELAAGPGRQDGPGGEAATPRPGREDPDRAGGRPAR